MRPEGPPETPRPTLEEIWASWSDEKRGWDSRYPWIYYCKRPLSLYLTRWLVPLGVTANQATAFSALALLGSLIGFSLGYKAGFVVGGLLLMVFFVADKVDGNLGRFLEGGSLAGEFFDNVAGTLSFTTYFFIGLGLMRTPDAWGHHLVAAATAEPDAALVGAGLLMLGAWTAIASLLTKILRPGHPQPPAEGRARTSGGQPRSARHFPWPAPPQIQGESGRSPGARFPSPCCRNDRRDELISRRQRRRPDHQPHPGDVLLLSPRSSALSAFGLTPSFRLT